MANFNSYLIQFSLVLLNQVSGAQNYDSSSLTSPYFGSLPQGEFDQIWPQVQQTLNQYEKGQSSTYKPPQKPSCPSQNQQQKPVEKPSDKPQQNGNSDQVVDILYPNKPSNSEKPQQEQKPDQPQQQKPDEKPAQNGNNDQVVDILYPSKPSNPEQPQQGQKPQQPKPEQPQQQKPDEKPAQNGNNGQIVDILYPNKPSNSEQPQQPKPEQPQQQKPTEKPSQNGNNDQVVDILYPNKPSNPEQPHQEQKPQQPKPEQPQQQKPTEKPSQNGNNDQVVDILYPNKPSKPEQPQQGQKPQQPKPEQPHQPQQPQQPHQPKPEQPQQPKPEKPQESQQPDMQCAARVPNNDPCSKSTAKDQGKFGTQMNQPYPSGQCTEWADARYKEIFGVNGQLNGDARLWVSDARRKGNYQVSAQPSVGAMVITQPGVLGAGSTGHVGIVEKVYKNGDVCVSNWNYPTPWKTTYIKQKGQAQGVDYIQKNGVQLKC